MSPPSPARRRYSFQPPQPLPDSLREVRGGGRFTITIVRSTRDSTERRLIEQAESLFPTTSVIESATHGLSQGGNIPAFATAARIPGPRWWWREWDGILLSYALTGAAVAHYVDRVRALSASEHPFPQLSEGTRHSASVTYIARIRHAPDVHAAHEVSLRVEFSFYCGPRCALSFIHERVVEFDATGNIVAVRGDQPPMFEVS